MRAELTRSLVIGALLVGCSSSGEGSVPPNGTTAPIEVGAAAPDFTLPSAQGGRESLARYRGRAVLLYFSMGPG